MAGASGWNQEIKGRLTEKVAVNMNDLASLTRQILRGSKSNEVRLHLCIPFILLCCKASALSVKDHHSNIIMHNICI